jgi:hypothetical protein
VKALLWIVSVALLAGATAVGAQHVRYLRARRDAAADRQALFHPASAFHVATYLDLAPEQPLLPAVRGFVDASEEAGGQVVYAGKTAGIALESSQVRPRSWDAIVLVQFPSRDAYAAAAATPGYARAREAFADSYAHGMRRSPWLNLGLPVALLGVRIRDVVQGRGSRLPLEPAAEVGSEPAERRERRARVVRGLLDNREYGQRAVVVLNLVRRGNAEQQAANAAYGAEMLGLMAEVGNGPLHVGDAVTVEGDALFDNMLLVYYPGVEYFAELLQSAFFAEIQGDKQLADTLAVPSVPLLPHL